MPPINFLMSIKLKIEKQFLYSVKKALRAKKIIIKYSKLSLKNLMIVTCLILLT